MHLFLGFLSSRLPRLVVAQWLDDELIAEPAQTKYRTVTSITQLEMHTLRTFPPRLLGLLSVMDATFIHFAIAKYLLV